jgi:hypothetical protein
MLRREGEERRPHDWCAKEGRDPKQVARTVNVGFYMARTPRASRAGETIFKSHWGANPERKGFSAARQRMRWRCAMPTKRWASNA